MAMTAYAGEVMPDLFQLGNTWIPEFVALRAIEPLAQVVAALTGGAGRLLPAFSPPTG